MTEVNCGLVCYFWTSKQQFCGTNR